MSTLSRRGFLEQSLLTTTAALAGMASAEPAEARTRRQSSANDKIHIAVIGANGRGGNHLDEYWGMPGVEVVAICDADTDVIARVQANAAKKGKPKPRGVQDIRKLLEDKEIDAVSIATPNHWHALAAIWALQAGKHVYVEKPVSHNVSEGRRIVEVAAKTKLICQAGTQSRSNKASQDAVAFLRSGKLGKISLARGLCYKPRASIGKSTAPLAIPASVDYDLWTGPAPLNPPMRKHFHYDWHWFWDYGSGDLGNQGIHQMDIARWALGKPGLPDHVMGLGGRFGYEDDGQTPNTMMAIYDYGDSQIIFEVRGLKTEGEKGVRIGNIIYGSDGYLAFTDNYGHAAAFDTQGSPIAEFTGGGNNFGNFLSAVRNNRPEDQNAPIEEGHLSSALCHLGNISYRLGRSTPFNKKTGAFGDDREAIETFGKFEQHLSANGVTLQDSKYFLGPRLTFDSQTERFQHNRRANSLLTRRYRAPYVVPATA